MERARGLEPPKACVYSTTHAFPSALELVYEGRSQMSCSEESGECNNFATRSIVRLGWMIDSECL